MFGGNLLSITAVYQIFYCLLLVGRVQSAYKVDAYERAMSHVTMSKAPLQCGGHLGEKHEAIRDLLGLSENEHMEVTEHIKTVHGYKVWRLHEKYLGVPVFDVSLTVSTDETGLLTGDATGEFLQGIEQDMSNVTPHLTQSEVLDIALKANNDEQFRDELQSTKCQLIVYFDDESSKARLVYKLEYLVENKKKLERPTFLIEANSGAVLLRWNNLEPIATLLEGVGGNEKIGPIYYEKGYKEVNLTQIGDTCFLENEYVKVVHMNHTTNKGLIDSLNFPCSYEYYDDINGGFSSALDAYYSANVVSRMFREWYDMSPLDRRIVFRVHYGVNIGEAFWDGDSCVFGDGDDTFYPLTALDIAAHELAHGITERLSGLLYFDESGSINEAFSDMTGEVAEAFDGENDWLVGADVLKKLESRRYFVDPTKDGHSLSHYENFTYYTNPHYGSGIYNRVFYIIVEEEKVPIKEAYRVFLLANKMYWHQRTTFASGACDVMKTAYDLGKDLSIFRKAFGRVGIKVCDISKYVIRLKNNRTVTNIRVEPQVHPVFSFVYPPWGVYIKIHASSGCKHVHIKVTDGNPEIENSTVIAEGTSNVVLEMEGSGKVFIQLSSDKSAKLSNVRLTVTYECLPEVLRYCQMNQ